MIQVPESVSTVIDRVTILRIKIRHRPEADSLRRELLALELALHDQLPPRVHCDSQLRELWHELQVSNLHQWQLEDRIREQVAHLLDPDPAAAGRPSYAQRFLLELVSALHYSNRKRSEIKAQIDQLCGDDHEIKIYSTEEEAPCVALPVEFSPAG